MESSPYYFDNPYVVARMNETFLDEAKSDKRFIVILRDSLSRVFKAYSIMAHTCLQNMKESIYLQHPQSSRGWNIAQLCGAGQCKTLDCHHKARFVEPNNLQSGILSFHEYIKKYGVQQFQDFDVDNIRRFLTVFERRQLLVINYDSFYADPVLTLSSVYKFLGLSSSVNISSLPIPVNEIRHRMDYGSDLHRMWIQPWAFPNYSDFNNQIGINITWKLPVAADCETGQWYDRHRRKTEELLSLLTHSQVKGLAPAAEPTFGSLAIMRRDDACTMRL